MAEMTEKIAVEWELKTESTRNRNKKRLEQLLGEKIISDVDQQKLLEKKSERTNE